MQSRGVRKRLLPFRALSNSGAPRGSVCTPEPASLSAGLEALRAGQDVDYQGAAGTLDWDEHGDSAHGYVGFWEFVEDGSIVDLEVFEFSSD